MLLPPDKRLGPRVGVEKAGEAVADTFWKPTVGVGFKEDSVDLSNRAG